MEHSTLEIVFKRNIAITFVVASNRHTERRKFYVIVRPQSQKGDFTIVTLCSVWALTGCSNRPITKSMLFSGNYSSRLIQFILSLRSNANNVI
jgi:hypothetical protein